MNEGQILRGHVYRVVINPETSMLCLVVSVNTHNARENVCTAVLVTADRNVPTGMPSWVRLNSGDPAFGHAVCSHIAPVHRSTVKEDLGAASMETMLAVGNALKRQLGL